MAGQTQSKISCNERPKVLDGSSQRGRKGREQNQTRPVSDFQSCFFQRIVCFKKLIIANRDSASKSRCIPSPETFHGMASLLPEEQIPERGSHVQTVSWETSRHRPFPRHPLPVPSLLDPARLP